MRSRSRLGYSKSSEALQPALRNTVLEVHNNHNDNMLQRKGAQLAVYGLQLSLLCAPYTKLRRQVLWRWAVERDGLDL